MLRFATGAQGGSSDTERNLMYYPPPPSQPTNQPTKQNQAHQHAHRLMDEQTNFTVVLVQMLPVAIAGVLTTSTECLFGSLLLI